MEEINNLNTKPSRPKRIWLFIGLIIFTFSIWVLGSIMAYSYYAGDFIYFLKRNAASIVVFIVLFVSSVGIFFRSSQWRIIGVATFIANFGWKVVDQIFLIARMTEEAKPHFLAGTLLAAVFTAIILIAGCWALLSKKSNEYFNSK